MLLGRSHTLVRVTALAARRRALLAAGHLYAHRCTTHAAGTGDAAAVSRTPLLDALSSDQQQQASSGFFFGLTWHLA